MMGFQGTPARLFYDFCLEDVPDHSTFSKNRTGRFRQSDMLRRLFETVVQRCLAEGLVAADRFAVDASLIAADASARFQAARGSLRRSRERGPPRARISCDFGQCGIWDGVACDAKIHLAIRSGGAMDRRTQGTRLLRLCQ